MDRSEMRKHVKHKLRSMGFQAGKSCFYKIIDDDYLIGINMEASTYTKGYQFYSGIIYLPDDRKMPYRGVHDLSWRWVFPEPPDGDPDVERCFETRHMMRILEYERYTAEQVDAVIDANYEYFIKPTLDKEYGLQMFRDNWKLMKRFSDKKIEMLCQLAGLDYSEVSAFLQR